MVSPKKKNTITSPKQSTTAPAPEERFITKEEAVSQSVFAEKMGWFEQRIKQIGDVTNLVVAVLFIGFITLLVTVLGIVVQVWGFNANIQAEMTKSINKQVETTNHLIEKMDNFKEMNPQTTVDNASGSGVTKGP